MKRLLAFALIACSTVIYAQDDLLAQLESEEESTEKEVIKHTWKSPYLINAHTTEMERKGVLDFRIAHRFGNLSGDAGGAHSLFGLDQASNIRFSFDYGVTDDFTVGLGRSKTNEHIDFLLKYKLLKQKKNGLPFSLVALSNTAYTPKKDPNNYITKAAHRFYFANQLVLGSKVTEYFSGLINLTHLHKNLVVQKADESLPRDNNDLVAVGVGGRCKLTRKLAIVGEYNYTFGEFRNSNSRDFKYYHPLSIGIELETGGHVFHINLSNSAGLINQDLIDAGVDSWLDGDIKLGFTISRFFAI